MATTADQDWFSFTGTAGQTAIIYLTPGSGDGFLRVFAGGGAAANRTQLSYIGFGTGLCVYTLPYTGTFYFRVLANSATVGTYAVYTGWDAPNPGDEIARDTRDVIMQSSPDGIAWTPRIVVNDDAARYDNAFPEVAVDAAGLVYADWYDHRSDLLGIGTDIFYSTSATGGATFAASAQINDGLPVNWSLVSSNLAPNMGDYSNLVADGLLVFANFADGRQGTPDSWIARTGDLATPTQLSLEQALASPSHVDLKWFGASVGSMVATVYRRGESTAWAALATVTGDGSGWMTYRDAAVVPGTRYEYRLGVLGASGTQYFGDTWVTVPVSAEFAIRQIPNSVDGSLNVQYTLPNSAPATIRLLDVSGRELQTMRVSASGQARLGGNNVTAGVYWVRLTQGAKSATTRAVFVK